MFLKCHKYDKIPRLFDIHLWETYANIHATYEVAPIAQMMTMVTQEENNTTAQLHIASSPPKSKRSFMRYLKD